MDTKKFQLYFFIALLIAVVVLVAMIFKPFIAPIALAFMAAIVVRPVDVWFLKITKNKRTLAAFATTLFVLLIIFVPIAFLVQQVAMESIKFYNDVRVNGLGGFEKSFAYSVKQIQEFIPNFNPDIEGAVRTIANTLGSNASNILSGTATFALGLFVALIALFYMLRDGYRFRKSIVELSPLSDKYDNDIIEKIERAVNSVMLGSLLVAVTQGIIATLGFLIFGVPHALLWGTLTAIVALLPGIGTGLTVIPAIFYLILSGSLPSAIGLAIWGIIAVGLVDNIIMPIVVGKGFTMHPLFVLLSVIGGIGFFGPIGLFLGPLVIALLSALVEIYKLVILDDKHKKTTSV